MLTLSRARACVCVMFAILSTNTGFVYSGVPGQRELDDWVSGRFFTVPCTCRASVTLHVDI